jgi:ABC-type lipoprotein release transport system permease subunit
MVQVKTTDATSLASPILTLAITATLATLPPAIRAMRTNPTQTLRSE